MLKIAQGNAKTEGQQRRGWFVGAFIESNNLQRNSDVEIKWGIHPKGEKRESVAEETHSTSISILISGKFGISFEESEEVILIKEGDYVMFQPNLPHRTFAYEDSVVITIRNPSLSSKRN